MPRPSLLQSFFLLGHGLIALIVVSNLYVYQQDRQQDVDKLKGVAAEEELTTEELRQQVAEYAALLEGLRAKDPYVIELLARDRLGYQHSERRDRLGYQAQRNALRIEGYASIHRWSTALLRTEKITE